MKNKIIVISVYDIHSDRILFRDSAMSWDGSMTAAFSINANRARRILRSYLRRRYYTFKDTVIPLNDWHDGFSGNIVKR